MRKNNGDIKEYIAKKKTRGLLHYCANSFPGFFFWYAFGQLWAKYIKPWRRNKKKIDAHFALLARLQSADKDMIEQMQMRSFISMFEQSILKVPYYKKIFSENKLDVSDFKNVDDLWKIPILKKDVLIKRLGDFITEAFSSTEIRKRGYLVSTSGTSGKPLYYLRDTYFRYHDYAFMQWRLRLHGILPFERYIQVWSRPFLNSKMKKNYFHDPYNQRLSLSSLPHSKDIYREYLLWIKRFKPSYVIASPSFMVMLARYAYENAINDIFIPYVYASYERIFEHQRVIIEKQFKTKVYSYYATEEKAICGFECEMQKGFHLDVSRSIVEIVDENDNPVSEGTAGRIICTAFNNYVMPLVRYEIGDVGVLTYEKCACGLTLPRLLSLEGRVSEAMQLAGKNVYPATFSVMVEKCRNVKECQFEKIDSTTVRLNIVPTASYTEEDIMPLKKNITELFEGKVKLEINYCTLIPRRTSGKFPFVISERR